MIDEKAEPPSDVPDASDLRRQSSSGSRNLPLLILAVMQAGFFLGASVPAGKRIVSLCLLAIAAAEWWSPWLTASAPKAGAWLLAGLCFSNYAVFAVRSPLPIEARLVQAALIFGYLGAALAGLTIVLGFRSERRAFALMMSVVVLLLAGELALDTRTGKYLWTGGAALVGSTNPDSLSDGAFAPSTVAWSDYLADPSGYFEDPEALRRSWRIDVADSDSAARLEFPDTPTEALRVLIDRSSGRELWSIQLTAGPIAVHRNDAFSLTFRARAARQGTLAVSIGLSDAPWGDVVRFGTVTLDTIWRPYRVDFSLASRDAAARLHFDIGRMADMVEFSRITLRRSGTAGRVMPVTPHRYAVRYRFNNQGCRGDSISEARRPGTRRILVIGGASALSVGVHEEDSFASQLEARLNIAADNARSSVRFEVLSCGFVGRTESGALSFFQRVTAAYAPDVTLLTVGPHEGVRWLPQTSRASPGLPGKLDRLLLTWNLVHGTWRTHGSRKPVALAETWSSTALAALRSGTRSGSVALIMLRADLDVRWADAMNEVSNRANDLGIPLVDTGAALFNRHGQADLVVDPDFDPHPNTRACSLAADATAAFLREHRLVAIP